MPIYLTDAEAKIYLARLAADPSAPPPDADVLPRVQAATFHSRSVHSGRRADLGGRYFRSAWEANYARYLDWLAAAGQAIRWEYEPDTFTFPVTRGTRSYTPDFKVWGWDARPFVYHEVKGYMDTPSRVKLDRMARYHPAVPVLLIDADAYHAIRKELSRSIAGWEGA